MPQRVYLLMRKKIISVSVQRILGWRFGQSFDIDRGYEDERNCILPLTKTLLNTHGFKLTQGKFLITTKCVAYLSRMEDDY